MKQNVMRPHPQKLCLKGLIRFTFLWYSYVRTYCVRTFCLSFFWRCVSISTKELAVNEEIKFKEVRTISADGDQLGIIPVAKALEAAYAADLDLVCISPNAQPPVCKIMDYGKYRFEQAKREKEAKKNQKTFEVK